MANEQKDLGNSRVLSIDALRGFDMFWIIGGGTLFESLVEVWDHPVTRTIQTQLTHVEWEGFRFEDLIFPTFIFVVGAVLPFSISRRVEQGRSRSGILLRILQRTAGLLLLGLILNGLLRFDWAAMRWPGVLQRIALCYFFAALFVLYTGWRIQAVAVPVILLLYWAVTMLVPVPGHGSGDLTMEGCLSSYIDQHLIPGVLYYKYGDNEGILSTLPAVATALLGVLAGHWLRTERTGARKAAGLALAGVVCIAVGYLWSFGFPIIKILWTSSYVLFAGGWSLLLLALFYWLIDVAGPIRLKMAVLAGQGGICLLYAWLVATPATGKDVFFTVGILLLFIGVLGLIGGRWWTYFFVVIGMNAITIYFLQNVIEFQRIAAFFLHGPAAAVGLYQPLLLLSGALAARWLFLWFLYRHKIFFRV